jgi:hypothetical protein
MSTTTVARSGQPWERRFGIAACVLPQMIYKCSNWGSMRAVSYDSAEVPFGDCRRCNRRRHS